MLRLLSFSLLFFSLVNIYAQRKPLLNNKSDLSRELDFLSDGSLSINIGASFPVGEFSRVDTNSFFRSYAKNSFVLIQPTFHYQFAKPIGICLLYHYQQFQRVNFDHEATYNNTNPGYKLTYQTGNINLQGFMGGLTYTFQSHRTNTDVRMMVGYLNSTLPEVNFFITNTVAALTDTFKLASSESSNWAMMFGVGLRYRISGNFLLHFNGDFLFTDITHKRMELYYLNTSSRAMFYLKDIIQPYRMFNFTIGIGYAFQ